jgi:hypothetical protein
VTIITLGPRFKNSFREFISTDRRPVWLPESAPEIHGSPNKSPAIRAGSGPGPRGGAPRFGRPWPRDPSRCSRAPHRAVRSGWLLAPSSHRIDQAGLEGRRGPVKRSSWAATGADDREVGRGRESAGSSRISAPRQPRSRPAGQDPSARAGIPSQRGSGAAKVWAGAGKPRTFPSRGSSGAGFPPDM